MNNVSCSFDDGLLSVSLTGRIDASNAPQVENEIYSMAGQTGAGEIVLDFDDLKYISSAGLRVLLKLKKDFGSLKAVNVHSEIYEILDMTGFVEMIDVQKAFRSISIDGCEVLGEGSNGIVYRLDPETIVKVYRNPDAIEDIKKERELARKALILGIPTAISFDIVKAGDSFASVFELINASSLSALIRQNPSKTDEYVDIFVNLLKQIHSTADKDHSLPSQKKLAVSWVQYLENVLPSDQYEKILALMEDIPETECIIHGDYHTKNLMMQNGEAVLIDMDTLAVGNPVFDFASAYLAFRGFGETDHKVTEDFLGISWDMAGIFMDKAYEKYFGTTDEKVLQEIKDKARLIGLVRLLRRTLKREKDNAARINFCRNTISEILPEIDSLAL